MPRPIYDLHTLGWQSFQDLCLAVSRTILGQNVMSFLDTLDGGRVGAFTGTWDTQEGEVLTGDFVIQCKFTGKPDFSLRLSDVSDEIDKAKPLVEQGRCDSYVLLTNANVSGRFELTFRKALTSVGVQHVLIHGADWLRQQIQLSPTLRAQVPRIYGIGDLSQILDARANEQTRAILDTMRDELETVVVTNAYQQAVSALEEHSLVLLVGAPATGKTTIASQLTMAALDMWEAQTYKVDGPADFRKHWNTNEQHQFFWIDDAFGVTQYDTALISSWNRQLSTIRAMLRKGVRIVLTSRDYIHARALADLKTWDLPVLDEAKIIVDVEALAPREKQQILYNHIKLGNQTTAFRRRIKRHLPEIAANSHFAPETARRLGDSRFTEGLVLSDQSLREFVEKPQDFLEETISQLDNDSRAALVLLFIHGGSVPSDFESAESAANVLARLGSDLGSCAVALRAMESSFVRLHQESPGPTWRFKHPTMSDAVAAYLARRGDLVDILVEGGEAEKLLSQVTCGDMRLENAVVVQSGLFAKMASKLDQVLNLSIGEGGAMDGRLRGGVGMSFLASRASGEFLEFYVERWPKLAESIEVRFAHLTSDPGARVLSCLHEHGLLSEGVRVSTTATLSQKALDEQDFWDMDLAALRNGPVAELLDESELRNLEKDLLTAVVPLIEAERESLEWSYESGPADSHMELLLSYCHSAKEFFHDMPEMVRDIEEQEMQMEEWIDEHMEEDPLDDWKAHAERAEESSEETERSLFDDIDLD